MKIELRVKYINGQSEDVDAIFIDFISYERDRKKSVVQFDKNLTLTDLAWLAWHSVKRNGKTDLAFDPAWLATVETVEVREEPAPDPT